MLPSPGTQRAWLASKPSPRRARTARPNAGAISRADRPSWATDAATRSSTWSGARPPARASAACTWRARARSASGEPISSASGRHGAASGSPGSWVSIAK